ncbi:hypothetical protein ACSBR2_017178 [Camellia fascicularis]
MAEEEDVPDRNPRFFVAVHVGAGFHVPSNEKALRSAMKRACLAATSVLRKGDPSTNAGRGSNLTEDGHVECDASIMDGDFGAFGAVGVVPTMKHGYSEMAPVRVSDTDTRPIRRDTYQIRQISILFFFNFFNFGYVWDTVGYFRDTVGYFRDTAGQKNNFKNL